MIVGVDAGSLAEDIGLLRGDVIAAINRTPVASADEVLNCLKAVSPGGDLFVKLMRHTKDAWVTLVLAGTAPTR
jgi:S1-C subfamily serine protease